MRFFLDLLLRLYPLLQTPRAIRSLTCWHGIFTCSQGTELPVCSRVSGWLTSDTANDGNALTAPLRSTPGQVRPCFLSCSNMRLLRPCRRNTDDREIQLYFDLIFENEHCLSLHKSALGLFEVAVSLSCLSAVISSVPLAQVLTALPACAMARL